MPLFAVLVGNIATGLAAFFAQFLTYKVALKLAAYTTWVGVFGAFLASVFVCMSNLYGYVRDSLNVGFGSGWLSKFFMGLGMFIPVNAGAVIACVASVWIACQIYKVQKQGLFHFSGG